MANLQSEYLGLRLRNPLIISSSGLTDNVAKIRKFDEFGAGAVVLKSLFEEQILHDAGKMIDQSSYPEAEDYLKVYTRNNSVAEYLELIEQSKKEVRIPVIASINCITANEWVEFSKNIENSGADALELNLFFLPFSKDKKASFYEDIYLDLVSRVKEMVKIPVVVKLGSHFTNLVEMVNKLYNRGVNGVVLFNRFYEPDIDIDTLKFKSADVLSSPADLSRTLRWVGMVSSQVNQLDIAASTGVHDYKGFLKMILAGAKAVMMCSALYKNGPEYVQAVLRDINNWLDKNNYKSIGEIRGEMNYAHIPDPAVYERSQFMKYFSSLH